MTGWISSKMENYTPPKKFEHIKNDYTNIYEWMDKYPDANCYYCGKSREGHEMEISFFASPTLVGICRLCFLDFRIGNLATDRFVVEHILQKYKRRSDIIRWFQRNGYEMFESDRSNDHSDDWVAYRFVNNPERYFEFLVRTRRAEPLPTGEYLTQEELQELNLIHEDCTRIEIFNDGSVHIVY